MIPTAAAAAECCWYIPTVTRCGSKQSQRRLFGQLTTSCAHHSQTDSHVNQTQRRGGATLGILIRRRRSRQLIILGVIQFLARLEVVCELPINPVRIRDLRTEDCSDRIIADVFFVFYLYETHRLPISLPVYQCTKAPAFYTLTWSVQVLNCFWTYKWTPVATDN